MNKNKKNRKGFTIVELVIVIAVIGILATVLVPTFSNIVGDAEESALLQEAKNLYTEYVAKTAETGAYYDDIVVEIDDKYYVVEGGEPKVATSYDDHKSAAAAMGVTTAGDKYYVFTDEKNGSEETVPNA